MALRADDVDLGRDRVLVEQYQEGDMAAFEDLYRRYYGRLFRFCLRRTGNPHDAEELAQEAFVRAYRAMPMLRGERRFYPWLSVIASRLCIDTHRRASRTEVSADVDPGSVSDPDRFDAAADHDLLTQALDRLTERHREVLHLREREGWSYQRIAEHYDISMGAVEGLLFRARQALRREFLAVAGPEAGLAAAAPFGLPLLGRHFGRLGRRFADLRMRAQDWMAEWFTLSGLASNAMGMAMVVTTVAGFASAVAVSDNARPVTLMAAASPLSATAAAHDALPVAAAPPAAAPRAIAPTSAAGAADPGRTLARAEVHVSNVDVEVNPNVKIVQDGSGGERTKDQPLVVPAPGLLAGLDPDKAAAQAGAAADHYHAQIRGEQP